MSTQEIANKTKEIPLPEKLSTLRTEINALDPREFTGMARDLVSRFRQNYSSCVFCYNEWDKNRDYSSVIHASLALGKLLDVNELMAAICDLSTRDLNRLRDSVNQLGSACWDNIRAGAGRITPFE